MNTTRVSAVVLACALAATAGCPNCDQDGFKGLEAQIGVNACASSGVSDCRLFFEARVGRVQVRKVIVKATGEKDLVISAVALSADSDPSFSITGALPTTVPTSQAGGATISVQFAPTAAGSLRGTLLITSDAGNAPEGGTVAVVLDGTGRLTPDPGHLTVSPPACDFGNVGVGTTATCEVTVGNDGESDLSVAGLAPAAGTEPPFGLAAPFPTPVAIPPGQTAPLRFSFAPEAEGEFAGAYALASDDPEQPQVDVALRGRAAAGPAAVARVLSVNGQPYDGARPLRAGDDVVVTGEDSTAAAGRTLAGFRWEVVSRPAASTAALSTPDAATTAFQSDAGGGTRPGLDAAGDYELRLTVTDDLGTAGSALLALAAGAGALVVTPAECAFGTVPRNTTADCALTLLNDAATEVSVTAAEFTGSTDSAFTLGTVALPLVLAPGATAGVTVQFTPDAARAFQGELVWSTSRPSQPTVAVPLRGDAADGPGVTARILSVNGAPYLTGQVVRPLDNVVLTGQDSTPAPGRSFVNYRWEVVARPDGSMVEHSAPGQVTTGFRYSNSGSYNAGVDIVGTFTSRLTVTDDLGQAGSAEVTFTTVPAEDFHVQLTWDNDSADVDLHLVRGGAEPFSFADDCYFANCDGLLSSVDWGGASASPRLDVDDTCGYGPENINIDAPAAGTYTVGVDFYGLHTGTDCSGSYATPSGQAVTCTVRIFIQGALRGEYTRSVSCAAASSYWNVAMVIWGPAPAVQELGTLATGSNSVCGGN